MTKKPVLIISHADCIDGATAAAIADIALTSQGFEVEHYPESHGYTSLPDVTNRDVYIVDFCYKRPDMEILQTQCSRLVLLDHHITAKESMEGFKCRCGEIHFDLNESGASLTWKHFFKDKAMIPEVPRLVEHVRDYDLWKFELENTQSVMLFIDSLGIGNIEAIKDMLRRGDTALQEAYDKGACLMSYRNSIRQPILDNAMEMDFMGHRVLKTCVYSRDLTSEIGAELAKKTGTFGVIYYQKPDGSLKLSLRSRPDFPIKHLAEKLGGGGHPCASGAILTDKEQIRKFFEGTVADPSVNA